MGPDHPLDTVEKYLLKAVSYLKSVTVVPMSLTDELVAMTCTYTAGQEDGLQVNQPLSEHKLCLVISKSGKKNSD